MTACTVLNFALCNSVDFLKRHQRSERGDISFFNNFMKGYKKTACRIASSSMNGISEFVIKHSYVINIQTDGAAQEFDKIFVMKLS